MPNRTARGFLRRRPELVLYSSFVRRFNPAVLCPVLTKASSWCLSESLGTLEPSRPTHARQVQVAHQAVLNATPMGVLGIRIVRSELCVARPPTSDPAWPPNLFECRASPLALSLESFVCLGGSTYIPVRACWLLYARTTSPSTFLAHDYSTLSLIRGFISFVNVHMRPL